MPCLDTWPCLDVMETIFLFSIKGKLFYCRKSSQWFGISQVGNLFFEMNKWKIIDVLVVVRIISCKLFLQLYYLSRTAPVLESHFETKQIMQLKSRNVSLSSLANHISAVSDFQKRNGREEEEKISNSRKSRNQECTWKLTPLREWKRSPFINRGLETSERSENRMNDGFRREKSNSPFTIADRLRERMQKIVVCEKGWL